MNNWNIQSRAHACQSCERRFADKEKYHTVLTDTKSDYVRLDVCEKCWEDQYAEGANERKDFISYWQGVYEEPPPAPPEPIQKDTAETLLRKLIETDDPKYSAASYILAVMLERKRQLRVKEQFKKDGRRVFVYEHPKTFDLFTIPDPDLQLDQLDDVQQLVAHLLEHGLEPAGGAPPREAEPSSADNSMDGGEKTAEQAEVEADDREHEPHPAQS
jgi:hypothetical protein